MEPEIMDLKLRKHLVDHGLLESTQQPTKWKIGQSKLSGRGIMATSDIEVDELIWMDAPLLIGPRVLAKPLTMCVRCFRTGCALFPCDAGCGLPVCSTDCQESSEHREAECAYLRKLEPICGPCEYLAELLPAVLPIKGLLIKDCLKPMVDSLKGHVAPRHGREIDFLKKLVKGALDPDDEEFMRQICRVMDTNSFETAVVQDESSTSLRALFPTGALTNHQCVPNTRHHVNDKGQLLVYAANPIPEGEEITMSYTELLWDTTMRRQFLHVTKHFLCQCSRCSDNTEFNSNLGALWCAKENCTGYLLPEDPLNFGSKWICNKCGLKITGSQILSIRAGIEAAIEEVIYKDVRKISKFIERELTILVPECNYFMMEMMFRIVSLFGRVDGCNWSDLADEELDIKIRYCKKLLQCLDKLNCGSCTKKGLILFELYSTNLEKSKRLSGKENGESTDVNKEVSTSFNEDVLLASIKILNNNIIAPHDYRELYKSRSLICS